MGRRDQLDGKQRAPYIYAYLLVSAILCGLGSWISNVADADDIFTQMARSLSFYHGGVLCSVPGWFTRVVPFLSFPSEQCSSV